MEGGVIDGCVRELFHRKVYFMYTFYNLATPANETSKEIMISLQLQVDVHRRRTLTGLVRELAAVILAVTGLTAAANGQSVAGVYSIQTSNGAITLTLEQQAQNVSGTLVGDDGTTFRVQGTFQEGVLSGSLANPTGTVAVIQGGVDDTGVRFHLVPLNGEGQADYASAQEFVMARRSGAAPGSEAASPLSGLTGGGQAPTTGSGLKGSYDGDIAGTAATLNLERIGASIRGAIDAGGYGYTLDGTADGSTGRGTFTDPQAGATMDFEIAEHAGALTLTILARDPSTGHVQRVPFEFRKAGSGVGATGGYTGGEAGAPNGPAAQNANVQRDPALVGSWSRSETYTSNDALSNFSARTRYFLQIGPDGTYAYGSGGMSAGLDNDLGSVSGNSGAGDVTRGHWRTDSNIVYIMEPGSSQWAPYAKYYLEGNSMMLTFGDGTKQVWHRR